MSHEWEMCKENVIPIKKGRAVQDCSNPVKPSQNSDIAFEGIIQENLSNAEGLLSAFVQYYTWIRRRAGDNKASAKALLERATNELLRFKQLSNNIQYIKLWIEYADLVSDPNDVFSFMQSNSVGVKLSLFWIAWAFVAEKSQNYQLADRIFQNGQCENAEPKSLLAQRYQQFQRRITRKYLTAMENGETFAPLNSMSSVTPATATAFVPSSKPVLSSIPVATSSSNASSFAVFTDFDDNSNSLLPATSLPKKQQRSFLANENQRLKENIGMVEKWTNPILPQTAANPVNNNSILIFTDPDLAPPSQQPVKSAPFISIFDDSQATSTPLANNKKVDSADMIHNDKESVATTFSIPVDPPESIVPEQQPMKQEEDTEDHTINTKLALEDIEKMFTEEDFF